MRALSSVVEISVEDNCLLSDSTIGCDVSATVVSSASIIAEPAAIFVAGVILFVSVLAASDCEIRAAISPFSATDDSSSDFSTEATVSVENGFSTLFVKSLAAICSSVAVVRSGSSNDAVDSNERIAVTADIVRDDASVVEVF